MTWAKVVLFALLLLSLGMDVWAQRGPRSVLALLSALAFGALLYFAV